MSRSGRVAIGVDLGGTTIKALAVTEDGKIVERASRSTEVSAGQARVVQNLAAVIDDLERQVGRPSAAASAPGGGFGVERSIGIGVPGVLDVKQGRVIASPNFPGWENFPLRDRLEAATGRPVVVENDANAAAIGEQWMGAARGIRDFLFITIGTGVGGGLVLDGQLWRGPSGRAGEFGHLKVVADGEPCGCGSRGCLESYANAAALVRFAREAMAKNPSSRLWAAERTRGDALDPAVIADAAAAGDEAARSVYRRLAVYLSMGIADVVHLLDLHQFIIGGGISEAFPLFAPCVRTEVAARVYGLPADAVQILSAQCGNDAGSLGMARLVFTTP
jgi:glucokinase